MRFSYLPSRNFRSVISRPLPNVRAAMTAGLNHDYGKDIFGFANKGFVKCHFEDENTFYLKEEHARGSMPIIGRGRLDADGNYTILEVNYRLTAYLQMTILYMWTLLAASFTLRTVWLNITDKTYLSIVPGFLISALFPSFGVLMIWIHYRLIEKLHKRVLNIAYSQT